MVGIQMVPVQSSPLHKPFGLKAGSPTGPASGPRAPTQRLDDVPQEEKGPHGGWAALGQALPSPEDRGRGFSGGRAHSPM